MNFIKKLSSILLSAALTITSVSAFWDVDDNTEEGKAIASLTDRGVISGYGNGLFGPENSLTRAEAVKVINKIFGYTLGEGTAFSDVGEDDWFYGEVSAAVNAGYISGFEDVTFRPNDALTKEQVCVMLDKIMNFVMLPCDITVSDPISDWARESVMKLLSNYLAEPDSDGRFHATEVITRGEFCVLLSQFALDNLPVIEPFDLSGVAREELCARLSRISTAVREVLCKKTDSPEIQAVFTTIADNMDAYMSDPSYDYKAGAEEAKRMYSALPDAERERTKTLLVNFFTNSEYIDDVQILIDFFF